MGFRLLSHLAGLTQNLNGSTNDVTFGYGYSPASEIASNTRSNDGYSFTLANANVASTANGLNQLTTLGAANVTYDARGNVTAVGAVGYGYYAENGMSVATAISGGYLYFDPVGRLSFIYDPADSAGINARQYSGHELVQERTMGGAIRRRYVFGAGIDEPLVWYEGTGLSDRRWLHADERGSVIAASDGSGNLVGSINRYDDYGSPQGGAITGRFGYTGQAWLPELGLYDYRARFYNPALGGRFMQTDPIGYQGGMNVYAYVGNNPVNRTDPLGLCSFITWGHFQAAQGADGQPAGPWKLVHKWTTQNSDCDVPSTSGLHEGGHGQPSGAFDEDSQDVVVTGVRPPPSDFYPVRARDLWMLASQRQPGTHGAPGRPENNQVCSNVSGWGQYCFELPPPRRRQDVCRDIQQIRQAVIGGSYIAGGGAAWLARLGAAQAALIAALGTAGANFLAWAAERLACD